jgi:hypothetical protein
MQREMIQEKTMLARGAPGRLSARQEMACRWFAYIAPPSVILRTFPVDAAFASAVSMRTLPAPALRFITTAVRPAVT